MNIDERNEELAWRYRGRETTFWNQGRFERIDYSEEHERRIAWFREARLGLFPHWSPMAVTGRGGAAPFLENWTEEQVREVCRNWFVKENIAREWVDLALRGGCKYIIFTTNHCDGLKMWNTKISDFNSLKLGPKRDLIGECLEAARAAGLRVGLYYSPSEPFAQQDPRYIGDDPPLADRHAFTAACRENPEYAQRYRERIYAEIEELCTQYGKLDIWWHDGPLPPEILPPEETLALFRRFQPDMLVNDRVVGGKKGNELMGDFATQDYNESPVHGQKVGEPGRDWETGMPINGSWSWVPESIHDTLRPRDILHRLYTCVSEQGNLFLSVAPKGDGTVDDASRQSIERVGEWVQDHAEAVYGRFERPRHRYNQAGEIIQYLTPGISKCARWALKDERTAYLWVHWWPGADWRIGNFAHTIKKVTLVRDGSEVDFEQNGPRIDFKNLPADSPDKICRYNILKIEFEPNPDLQ